MTDSDTKIMVLLCADPVSASLVRVNLSTRNDSNSVRKVLRSNDCDHTTLLGCEDLQLGMFVDGDGRIGKLNRAATKIVHTLKWKTYRIFDAGELVARSVYGNALLYADTTDMTEALYSRVKTAVRERSVQTDDDARKAFDENLANHTSYFK